MKFQIVKTTLKAMFTLSSFLFVQMVSAEWSAEGELGYNATSGNSSTQSVALGFGLDYEKGEWRHRVRVSSFFASNDGEASAEIHELDVQSFHAISDTSYKFGSLRYQTDRFSGYDHQFAPSLGVGRHLLSGERQNLDAEFGLGFRRSELAEEMEMVNERIYTARATYTRDITSTASLDSWVIAEQGRENTYYGAEVSINLEITKSLKLKASFLRKRNSNRPAEADVNSDLTKIVLAYSVDY